MNLGNLFLVFLILKLTGVIAWSWWMVTLPLWIIPAIVVGLFVAVVTVGGLISLVVLLVQAVRGR